MKYIYMIGGNIISALFMWLITLYLVRTDALEELGLLSLVQSLGLMFFVFCTFKLLNVQITDTKNDFSDSDYYFARLISAFLCFALVSIYINLSNYDYIIKVSCAIYAFYYSLMLVKEYFSANYQKNKQYKNIFLSNSLSGFLSFLGFTVTFFLTADFIKSLVVMVLSRFFCILLDHKLLNINFRNLYQKFSFNKAFCLIKNNFFLGISAVLISGLILVPRFYIEGYHGLEALGVFSALTSIMFFINIFLNSLTQVFLKDTLDVYIESRKKAYKNMAMGFFSISSIICLCLIPIFFIKDFITTIIFGEKFLVYSNEFFYAIVLSVFLFWFNYGNFILTVQKNFSVQIYISFIVFLCQLVFCFAFVGTYGYLGAFFSMAISYILGFLFSFLFFLRKEIKHV